MELYNFLVNEGYFEIRQIPGIGYCGLHRLLYTVGLFINCNEVGYDGRYCYANLLDAVDALRIWDGTADPPGPWIKYKGIFGERENGEDEESKSAYVG